eukprot:TRINITY_DN7272_c0_g1_i1.p1 TRINITY_DN7272_c0_g1~~TRINITY_DN7272_c0_g1_i1.p1  ORF type:complete len:3025 (-),score=744.59 TRINITY_DN7272_c0_g1_i1:27-7853(-)
MNEAAKKKEEHTAKLLHPATKEEDSAIVPQPTVEAPPVRMMLNLDITAPLILVPSSVLNKNGNTSFILLDLGHILITHDSGPVEEQKDYGSFLIRLKRIGLYVQETNEAPEEDKALINPFSIDLDIATRVSKNPSLPATKLHGKLDEFKIDLTKDKLRDIIQVVMSIQPPPPMKETKRDSQLISEAAPGVTEIPKSDTKEMTLGAVFELGEFCISVRDTGENKPVGGQPLLNLRMQHLKADVEVSTWETKAGLTLDALYIEDCSELCVAKTKEDSYLLYTPQDEKLISFMYTGIPKTSPLYKQVEHDAKVSLGALNVNMNRITVALILQFLMELQKQIVLPPAPAAAPTTPSLTSADSRRKSQIIATSPTNSASLPSTGATNFHLECSLSYVSLSLLKEGTKFFETRIEGIGAVLNIMEDETMSVTANLKYFGVRDIYGTAWPEIVSTGGEKEMAVAFTYSTFNPQSPKYPGYDMQIGIKMASIKVVFVNRFVQEIITYFGTFAKIQEIIAGPAQRMQQAALDSVKETATATSETPVKLSLDINVGNPLVIVPVISTEKDKYLMLDLGNIQLGNRIETRGKELVDHMNIKVANVNLKTVGDPQYSPSLFLPCSIALNVSRPITPDVTHQIPVEVAVDISAIDLNFEEGMLPLFLSILSGNVSEAASSEDLSEVEVVTKLLDFDTKIWLENQTEATLAASQSNLGAWKEGTKPWKATCVKLRLNRIGFKLSRGGGSKKVRELVKFEMNGIGTDIDIFSDSGMYITSFLHGFILEDIRQESENVHRRIIAPTTTSDSENQIDLRYEAIPATSTKPASAVISVNMFAPRFVLLPDVFADLHSFAMTCTEKAMKGIEKYNKAVAPPTGTEEEKGLVPQATANEAEAGTMEVKILLRSPEIIAMEDTTSSNPSSFILSMKEISVNISTSGDKMLLDLGLKEFGMMRGILMKVTSHKRGNLDKKIFLLNPFDVVLKIDQKDGRSDIGVKLGSIETIVSYRDLATGLSVFSSFEPLLEALTPEAAPVAPVIKKADEPKQKVKKTSKNPDKNLIALDDDDEGKGKEKEKTVRIVKDLRKETQKIIISFDMFSMNILDDSLSTDFSTPLVKIVMSEFLTVIPMYDVTADPSADSMEVYITVGTILFNSYNQELSSYEPFVEPWGLQLKLTQSATKLGVHLTTVELININFTKPLLDTIFNIVDLSNTLQNHFQELVDAKAIKSGKEKEGKGKKKEKLVTFTPAAGSIERTNVNFYPFVIRNKTGKAIQFWLKRGEKVMLKSGEESPITAEGNARSHVDRRLSFEVLSSNSDRYQYGKVITDIPYDVVGKKAYSVSGTQKGLRVVVHIEYTAGSKIVTVRSDRVLKNHTSFDLEVSLLSQKKRLAEVYPLPSNSELAIPIDKEFDEISTRPVGGVYDWSEMKQIAGDKSKNHGMLFCSELVSANHKSLWACAAVIPESDTDFWLNLYPPCHFENLLPVPITLRVSSEHLKMPLVNETLEPGKVRDHYFFGAKDLKDLVVSIGVDGHKASKTGHVFGDAADNAASSDNAKVVGLKKTKTYSVKEHGENGKKIRILGDHFTDSQTRMRHVNFYTKYWISNCTGLPLVFHKAGKMLQDSQLLAGQTQKKQPPGVDPRLWYTWDLSKNVSENHPTGLNSSGPECPRLMYGWDDKLKVSVGDSTISEKFPLGVTNEGRIEIPDATTNRLYSLAVIVNPAPGRFFATSTARFYPGTILVNMTGFPISYKQVDDATCPSAGWVLKDKEQIPFHWNNKNISARALQFRIGADEPDETLTSDWSLGFSIDAVADFQIRLRNSRKRNKFMGVNVSIRSQNGTNYIALTGDEIPIYRINNQSSDDFEIWQKNVSPDEHYGVQVVHSRNAIPFFWDNPQEKDRVLLIRLAGSQNHPKEIVLDKLEPHRSIRGSRGNKIHCEVVADGMTKVLQLSDKEGGDEESSVESASGIPVYKGEVVVQLALKIEMTGIGICCIHERRSLVYATAQQIKLEYQQANVEQTIEATIGTVQIDNQLYRTPFPVVLFDKSPSDLPFLHFSFVQDTRYEKINFIKYLAFLVQEMELMIDGIFLLHIVSFVTEIMAHVNVRLGIDMEAQLLQTPEKMLFLPASSLERTNWNYFEVLHLNPVKAYISHLSVTEEEDQEVQDTSGLQSIFHFVGLLTDLDKAPLALNGLVLENVFASQSDLIWKVVKHYSTSVIAQSYLIIGSADFLGNPVSLISSLGTGVFDFFYEPIKGVVKSPKDFGLGIAKGTTSLLRNSLTGVFETASKLTGTVAKLGVAATFDEDYRKARARMQQVKARHVGEGFVLGFRDLGVGLYKGVTGIVTSPIEGAIKEGAAGFFKGVGIGVAGAFIKPMVGVADFATRTAEGIKNTTLMIGTERPHEMVPIRPPRHFSSDGLLRIYNFKKAIGQKLLNLADRGAYRKEFYAYHVPLKGDNYCIVTETIVLKISPSQLEAIEGLYVTAFKYNRPTLAEIKLVDTETLEFFFKVRNRRTKAREIETQEVTVDTKEVQDIKSVHKKLCRICQPKGLGKRSQIVPGGNYPLQAFSGNVHNSSESEHNDFTESDDELGKIIQQRRINAPKKTEKQPLLQKEEEESPPMCECCGGCTLF